VQTGGSLVIEDTRWERFTRVAEAVSGGWASRVGKPVGGMQGVLLLGTNGKWKVPLGIRLWRKGGPAKVELASGLLRPARRRGLQPAYILCESWSAAAEIMNLLEGGGGQDVRRLKRTRTCGDQSLRTTWSQRYGHARGEFRGVEPPVWVVKGGRRYWGTNELTRTPREVKAQYCHRQQIEEPFRLLKQEVGWGSWSCRKPQAQGAHLHVGLYALFLTHQTAFAHGQTLYALRQSLLLRPIPHNPLILQEFAQAA
jgi:hypothetical protein